MLFLKNETLPLGGESVLLHELSALQRADYFEYLASLEDAMPEDISDMQRMALMVKRNVQVNAWLVSRSLWHNSPEKDECEMHQEIMRTWPSEALNLAVEKVMSLSGMTLKVGEESASNNDAEEQDDIQVEERPLAK